MSSNPIPLSPSLRAGDFVYVSGMVAKDFFVGDFPKEVDSTLDRISEELAKHGADLSNVVKVGAYLSNSLLFNEFNEVYARRFGDTRPTRTTVVVDFAHSNVRVEMDVVAYVGS
ncbi:MAG TPA: RidA family protein [Candidatus Avipropionibacterium avicola]|uniref:RidA family protein n=1 Tax=Candidatus Avipropionibacterium avicola TaxID=2840701 RepID=A0A9D1KN50_9ACTN|nr:RidA family protein [Candidatus Avipropionibacterium avicola]